MIIVTGGAGFIGSSIVRALNVRGEDDILVVDDLSDASKIQNLRDCRFADYVDKDDLLMLIENEKLGRPKIVFHQGACSDTMEMDGKFMMDVNYTYSKRLLRFSVGRKVPFIYASSASVYGAGQAFAEQPGNEDALNVYAFSKLQFDRYARRAIAEAVDSQIVGLRYFNVYGPGETHKENMASVVHRFYHQYRDNGRIELFEGSGGYGDGEQERDFIWVGDVADVNLHFLDHPDVSGVFNVGTGISRTFNDVALSVINAHEDPALTLAEALSAGKMTYVPFPEGLRKRYQSYTCADTKALRSVGYESSFLSIEDGVNEYVKYLIGEL